ncbi:DUF4124 domain-containing protein [Neisseria leonii]|uniref:DUF4124 domain-containing protein n=1 Tax=Neisseria leonii TaxID=2995413 RepID=UPI00237ABAF8|nr:DUF4124 domain-containing protein [Neisseria sp. 3986]MDD9325366.1 hypothetical protein [Neisseria sp. 3986]
MERIGWVWLGCLLSLPVQAAVYRCESGGVTVYTSRPGENCYRTALPPIGSYREIPPQAHRARSRAGIPPPVSGSRPELPRSGARTDSRRQILLQELADEQRAAAEAQQALADASASGDAAQIRLWRGRLQDRRLNLKALAREIGRR